MSNWILRPMDLSSGPENQTVKGAGRCQSLAGAPGTWQRTLNRLSDPPTLTAYTWPRMGGGGRGGLSVSPPSHSVSFVSS